MKYSIHIISIAAAGAFLSGCGEKQEEVSKKEAKPSTPLVVAMETYVPPGGKPLLAPEGVVFLKQHVTHQHSNGIKGLPPGTAVEVEQEKPDGTLVVRHDGRQFPVKQFQVTKDMSEAEWLFQLEQAKQRQLVKSQAEQKQLQAAQERERQMAFERAIAAASQKKIAAAPSSPSSSAPTSKMQAQLPRGAYNPSSGSPVHVGAEVDGRRYWLDRGGNKHYFGQYHGSTPQAGTSVASAPCEESSSEEPSAEISLPPLLQKLLRGELK